MNFLKSNIFLEFSSTNGSEETIYTNNLEFAKKYFSEKLSSKTKEEIEALYRNVTQNLLFNIFTISDEVDVCVAFETMNNRGKPLSNLELLKNRLIYLSLKLDVDQSEKDKLRRAINDCWKSVYHNLGRNKNNPLKDDEFLNAHYLLHFVEPLDAGENNWKVIYQFRRRLERRASGDESYGDLLESIFVTKKLAPTESGEIAIGLKEIYEYVSSLQAAVVSWYRINNPIVKESGGVDYWLDKLNRIDHNFSPLILAILTYVKDDGAKIDLLKKLERFEFINKLSKTNYHFYGESLILLNEAIKLRRGDIDEKELSKIVSEQIQRLISSPTYLQDIAKEFQSSGFYSWSGIRYFLYEYNLHLQEKSKTERKKLDWMLLCESEKDHKSIEHIYPQNARAGYWKNRFSGLSQKQRNSLKNAIGNLLPLSVPKNSSLSNRPFPEKVARTSENPIGYRFGCYAENEVAQEVDWTQQAILRRSIRLLRFMEKRWGFKWGSDLELTRLLGLEFVKVGPSNKGSVEKR